MEDASPTRDTGEEIVLVVEELIILDPVFKPQYLCAFMTDGYMFFRRYTRLKYL
jgi:hypothetical protein